MRVVAALAQLVEQFIRNEKVASSIPASGTKRHPGMHRQKPPYPVFIEGRRFFYAYRFCKSGRADDAVVQIGVEHGGALAAFDSDAGVGAHVARAIGFVRIADLAAGYFVADHRAVHRVGRAVQARAVEGVAADGHGREVWHGAAVNTLDGLWFFHS